jgi:hypothetical protein
MKTRCNGYELKYNRNTETWQIWHKLKGYCGNLTGLQNAVNYCLEN